MAVLSGYCGVLLAEQPQPGVERLKSSPVLRDLRPNPLARPASTPPEETLAQMHVPDGFRVDLVAVEPRVHQPVAFAWDGRGRLWVAEAHSYPTRRAAGEGLDQLVIFADEDGDGQFETRKVFARGLNLVSGFEVGYGGVWIGAAPELLFLPDANHDDVPDGPPRVLLNGFGYQDTHECLNSFLWGPDGWLYGIQGVFNFARIGKPGAPDSERQELRAGVWRYHPVRHEFEVFAHGGSNPWGLDYDEHGQLFMTHCRSYWGRGGTTHVIQGGQFWNQANANYAPFIVGDPPREFPGFRNYLLASARYDHGAGGAGAPGSDAIYGGHSHVGTLIYQGDNWPAEYRGHLFTHNLHGHQINQQVNHREGSGFNTVHAGLDVFFCSDPRYVAVDLQSGPDGAVYFIDWYDQQHCHNPNTERWDRSTGRIYRMAFAATYQPRAARLDLLNDRELAALLAHPNVWYSRTAQRLLTERSLESRRLDPAATAVVQSLARNGTNATLRLRGLWAAHATQPVSAEQWSEALRDPDDFVRGWAIQFAAENGHPPAAIAEVFISMARTDPSPLVRLYLASAAQRLPEDISWRLIETLASHAEDSTDRNLPPLLWAALAQRLPRDPGRAFSLAGSSRIPQLADWIHWYAATLEGAALDRAVASLDPDSGELLRRRLAGLWLAMEPRANIPRPPSWNGIAPRLYASRDPQVVRPAQQLAAVFGDNSPFPALRTTLADRKASKDERRHAFSVLSRAQDPASLPVFLDLLDDPEFRSAIIPLLARYDSPDIAPALVSRFSSWSPADQNAVLTTLSRRPAFALALLDAVTAGKISRIQLTSMHMRQLGELRNAEVDRRIAERWGRLQSSSTEKQSMIAALEKTFDEAPLWAYDAGAGRGHFQRLCSSCHVLGQDGNRIGPELSGAGRNGIRYFLENVLDPNAVIGTDFQLTTVETKSGDVVSGLVIQETGSALTLRTATEQRVIARNEVTRRDQSDRSLMPEGLLESLAPREQIELLKYLTSN
jgi:putative membrane-bound dehydrogenase-like protein